MPFSDKIITLIIIIIIFSRGATKTPDGQWPDLPMMARSATAGRSVSGCRPRCCCRCLLVDVGRKIRPSRHAILFRRRRRPPPSPGQWRGTNARGWGEESREGMVDGVTSRRCNVHNAPRTWTPTSRREWRCRHNPRYMPGFKRRWTTLKFSTDSLGRGDRSLQFFSRLLRARSESVLCVKKPRIEILKHYVEFGKQHICFNFQILFNRNRMIFISIRWVFCGALTTRKNPIFGRSFALFPTGDVTELPYSMDLRNSFVAKGRGKGREEEKGGVRKRNGGKKGM